MPFVEVLRLPHLGELAPIWDAGAKHGGLAYCTTAPTQHSKFLLYEVGLQVPSFNVYMFDVPDHLPKKRFFPIWMVLVPLLKASAQCLLCVIRLPQMSLVPFLPSPLGDLLVAFVSLLGARLGLSSLYSC